MNQDFSFRVRWLERLHGTTAERETFGEVEIRWGGLVLTELEDIAAATVRPAARLSVLHLGSWLVANWWRLRWEPLPAAPDADWRIAHQMGGAGGGFAWPALQFAADGETITLSLNDTLDTGLPVRYLRRVEGAIDAETFERAVDNLMSVLLERLTVREAEATDLNEAWAAVQEERRDGNKTIRRRREALLGLDPDEMSASDLAAVVSSGSWMGEAALDEIFAAARASQVKPAIQQLQHQSLEAAPDFDLEPFVEIAESWKSAPKRFREPWERGVALANSVRQHLGLSPEEPVISNRLADLVGRDVTTGDNTSGNLAAGFRATDRPHFLRFRGIRRHPNSRRFEAARLIADFIEGPETDNLLPITGASTARQKVQRSFAQEFLSPIDGLAALVPLPYPNDSDIEAAAEHFEVSEYTVRSALVNRRLVDRRFLPG